MGDGKFVIGVMGTQNTGKSTFIHDILDEFSETSMQFRTVGCDYRKKIEEKGLKINRTGNLMSQRIIMDTLLEQLDIIGKMPDGNYIMDRTPLDAYVYTIYLQRHRPELGITEQNLDGFLSDVLDSLGKYDLLIFLDLDDCGNVEVVDDRFRDTDLDYRREIDGIFKEVLSRIMDMPQHASTLKRILRKDIKGTRQERVGLFLETQCRNFKIDSEWKDRERMNTK